MREALNLDEEIFAGLESIFFRLPEGISSCGDFEAWITGRLYFVEIWEIFEERSRPTKGSIPFVRRGRLHLGGSRSGRLALRQGFGNLGRLFHVHAGKDVCGFIGIHGGDDLDNQVFIKVFQ